MQRMLDGGGRGPSSETCTVHSPINSPLSYDDWEYDQIIQSLLSRFGTLGCFSTLKGYESGRRSNKLNCYCRECLLIVYLDMLYINATTCTYIMPDLFRVYTK